MITCFFVCFHHSWILYEKPDFQGRTIALEEGGIELTNVWAEPEHEPGLGPVSKPHSNPPMVIGSIRHAVWVSALEKYLDLIWPFQYFSFDRLLNNRIHVDYNHGPH